MEALQQLAAAGLVLGLVTAMMWALRRRSARAGRIRPGDRLEILERLRLTPQHTLHLVRVDGRTVLIGAHASGCTLLSGAAADEVRR